MFLLILTSSELDACAELHCERAQVIAAHILAGILASLFLRDKLRAADGSLCSLLIQEVDDAHAETEFLVDIPVDAAEGFPMTVKVECLLKVGVGLAEVAETEPCVEVFGDVILGIQLDEHLRYLLHYLVVGIDAHGLTVAERHAGVIVLIHRLLISEEGVHVEVLERRNLG